MFDHRAPIDCHLTTEQSVVSVVLVAGRTQHGIPAKNARPHLTRRTLNSLTGFDILPCSANSPDLNPIEHLWNLIRSDMNRRPWMICAQQWMLPSSMD
ncbi:hypothetical protein TNCV_4006301 [Trichonephila clavipes]|nr:hypothetical protein TNCV_4006301 [Trichonephila clavipes]